MEPLQRAGVCRSPSENEVEEPTAAATPVRAQPTSHAASYDTGYSIDNPSAAPVAYGSAPEQAGQAAALTLNSYMAARNAIHAPGNDSEAASILKHLSATPPDLKGPTEVVNYSSTLKGVRPEDAFAYFTKNPTSWFGASGITLHPPTAELKDGARVYLAEPGVTPPVFAPIEVHIDEASRTVRITTLDGHPLRGVNQFSFDANADGDCEVHQSSIFQLSSFAAEQGAGAMGAAERAGVPGFRDPIDRQHEIWQRAHADLADRSPRR